MRTLSQILERKLEIRELVKADGADLGALERELDELEVEERTAVETRQQTIGALVGTQGQPGPLMGAFGTSGPIASRGTELRSFGLGDEPRSIMRPTAGPNLASVVRGMATGDWSHVPAEQRTLISSGAMAAIPGASVLAIQEQAMAQSVVFRAGARIVNIDRPSEKIARVVSTGTPQWAPDTADRDLTDAAIEIRPEDLTAFSAWLYTECSIESLEDSTGLEEAITSAFARQLSLLYDEAGIAGTGINMPKGVCAMTNAADGINELPLVGALVDHKPFIRGAGTILGMNHVPSSVMIDTDTWTDLAMLEDTTGQPIAPPKAYTDLNQLVSNFLPAGNAVVADWSKWLFGERTNLTLEVTRTGTGFKKGNIQIRAYIRFGAIAVDPSAFCRLSGITLGV